jgi:uncharacterized protein YjbJ (UPF0337 family)
MNEDTLKGQWREFKGELQKSWGKITGDEYEATKGDVNAIAGLLQQRYGLAKEEASRRISELAARFHISADSKVQRLKKRLRH